MAPRFVDADYIAAKIRSHKAINSEVHAKMVEEAPETDVAPVAHGRWIAVDSFGERHYDWDDSHDWKCPVCNADVSYLHSVNREELQKYCHECGAKMDLEEKL